MSLTIGFAASGLPALNLKWTHLNPQRMISLMHEMNRQKSGHFSYMAFVEIMNRVCPRLLMCSLRES